MNYFFGRKEKTNGYSSLEGVYIEADSLEFAIYKFAYTENNIYKYLSDYNLSEYNYDLNRYVIKDGCYDKAEINIYAKTNEDSESELVKTIKISELENFNFDDVEKKLSSKGQKADSQEIALLKDDTVKVYDENLPQEFKEGKIKTVKDFNNCRNEIEKKMLELEKQKQELKLQVAEMEKWLKGKYRVICAYETYLGTKEEVVELIGEGKTSNEPIHLYQAVRFMDEEYGIVNLEKITETTYVEMDDFDYKNIDLFDKWIVENYKMFIPSERGIVMWRIKRRNKDYGDTWENMTCNGYNANCYFLIRNGERLYRIFSDVVSKDDTMFPTEQQSIDAGYRFHGYIENEEFDQESFMENTLPWKYILIAIQGILDRTDILGTDCQFKTNLICGLFDKEKIVLVRDKERKDLIGDDTMPSWYNYLKENRNKTKIGDRIIITDLWGSKNHYSGTTDDADFIYEHDMDWRRKYVGVPKKSKVYEIKDYNEKKDKYKILYFEERYFGDTKRKRTAIWLDKDEFFNISQTTEKDLKYYLNDRRERENYLDMLPKIKLAYKYFKTKAYEREDYFREHFMDD
jgi:hypothetical protein